MSSNVFDSYGIRIRKFESEGKIQYRITIKDKFVELSETEFIIFVGSMDIECNENMDY